MMEIASFDPFRCASSRLSLMSDDARRGRGRALYEEIRARVLDGTYAAGTALPSTRTLAAERGLSRTTVSAVYDQLAADGFIETRAGAASRVSQGIRPRNLASARPERISPESAPGPGFRGLSAFGERVTKLGIGPVAPAKPGAVDFVYGPIAGSDFPTLAWSKASRKIDRERPRKLAYGDARGDAALRRALHAYLARARGIVCNPEQLLIVNGSQQALDMCARLLLDPGDRVVVENPGYRMAHHVFTAQGARLHGVGVDEHGLRTNDLRQVRSAALAYVTPTHQFPLGSFLTMPRRQALLAWAAKVGAWVVEDDYDSEYRFTVRPEPALLSLDRHGLVIYIGTFSKTLSPELRLGYMIVPPRVVEAFAFTKRLTDRHAASHGQRTLALLLEDGSYERHVRRIRREQDVRRNALLHALDRYLPGRIRVVGASSGLHVVAWFEGLPRTRESDLAAAALREGALIHPISSLYLSGTESDEATRSAGFVLGYASLDAREIEQGVKRLAAAVKGLA